MDTKLSHLRREYMGAELDESQAQPDPLKQFEQWMNEAIAAEMYEPNAMTLATYDRKDHMPYARVVLLKEVRDGAFVWYTNYTSDKARQLEAEGKASLLFYWPELHRQVHVSGTVDRVPAAESEAYFRSRPRSSQLGAWASNQSQPVTNRAALEAQLQAAEERFKDADPVPRPDHWGGYQLRPHRVEFWQGRASRLHDRLLYVPQGESWKIARLNP